MRDRLTGGLVAGLSLVLAGMGSSPVTAGPCVQASPVNDRCEVWAATYDDATAHGNGGEDYGLEVVAGQDLVYTAALSKTSVGYDIVVIAYRQDSGAVAWTRTWDVGEGDDDVYALELIGSTLMVAGESSRDFLVVGLDAATGDVRWSDRRNGPARDYDVAYAVTGSPDGSTVFAAGMRDLNGTVAGTGDAWLIAYDVATGDPIWETTYAGPAGIDFAEDIEVAPGGDRVYLTMTSAGQVTGRDLVVAAFESEEEGLLGQLLWDRRVHGGTGNEDPVESVLSADGERFYVALTSQAPATGGLFTSNMDILTLALATSDGTEAWVQRVDGAEHAWDYAQGIVLAGELVVVAGSTTSRATQSDVVVLAYEAGAGTEAWRSVSPPVPLIADLPADIAVAPDGGSIYLASTSKVPRTSGGVQGIGLTTNHGTIITTSYAVDDGDVRWSARHSSAAETAIDQARSLAVAPDGTRVFVAGWYGHRPVLSGNLTDAVTVAYDS